MIDSTRIRKKACACTVLILFSFFGFAVRAMAEEKLVVGYFNIPPLSMKDPKTQQASGIAIDYFRKRIAPAIKVPIEFQELPFARMVDLLESGNPGSTVHGTKSASSPMKSRT